MSRDFPALIPAFRRLSNAGEPLVLATIVETQGSTYRKAGARMLVDGHGNYYGVLGGGCFEGDLVERSRAVIEAGESAIVEYDMRGDEDLIWGLGLGCNGLVKLLLQPLSSDNGYQPMAYLADTVAAMKPAVMATGISGSAMGRSMAVEPEGVVELDLSAADDPRLAEACRSLLDAGRIAVVEASSGDRIFMDVIPRQHHLLVIGAGPDAVPMTRLAADLHWRVTVADHREQNPGAGHFPASAELLHVAPEALAGAVALSEVSAALLMTHNFAADAGFLRSLASQPPSYVGLLGPAARRAKLLEELEPAQRTSLEGRIRGPVGLNLGGESPASIALAAIAEIHAELEGADATPLNLAPSRGAA